MINDKCIAELHDFLKPDLLFRDVNLRGGVCYFLWDKSNDENELTKVFTYRDDLDNPEVHNRSLRTKGSTIFIRNKIAVDILEKVKAHTDFHSFESHVSSRKPFGLESNIVKDGKLFRLSNEKLKDPVKCYGKGKKVGYLERSEVRKNPAWIDRYKIYVPYANNIGTELNDDNLNTFIGAPKTISTETYLVMGVDLDLNKTSAKNLTRYFCTKFSRFMHGLQKISQHGTAKTYKFVPLQDFTSKSDINWEESIEEIDQQLYKKYKLTKKEIEFIENTIKPMK